MVGIDPNKDYLFDTQQKDDASPVCVCCKRPVSQCSSYTDICDFIFCEHCMNTAVTVQTLDFAHG